MRNTTKLGMQTRPDQESGSEAIDRGSRLFAQTLAKIGVDEPDALVLNMPYDQLKVLAFAEKYEMGPEHAPLNSITPQDLRALLATFSNEDE